jgi:hypothetical protein
VRDAQGCRLETSNESLRRQEEACNEKSTRDQKEEGDREAGNDPQATQEGGDEGRGENVSPFGKGRKNNVRTQKSHGAGSWQRGETPQGKYAKAGEGREEGTRAATRKPAKPAVNWKAAEKLLSQKSGLVMPPAKKAAARKPAKKAAARKPAKKVAARKPAKKSTKLDPRTKRRRQNKALVKRVDKLETKRQRNRKKSLTKRARKKTAKEIREERKRIERLRLDRERKRLKRLSERKRKVVTFADEMSESFADLLGEAFRTNQAPTVSKKRKMDKYEGRQLYVTVRRILTPEAVEDILHDIRQKVQKAFPTSQWPLWLASIHFASMGENLLGYGHSILRSDKPGADMFTAQATDSTGLWSSRIGMLDKLEDLLEKYAGEAMNVIFLYHVRIMNYDRSKVQR